MFQVFPETVTKINKYINKYRDDKYIKININEYTSQQHLGTIKLITVISRTVLVCSSFITYIQYRKTDTIFPVIRAAY